MANTIENKLFDLENTKEKKLNRLSGVELQQDLTKLEGQKVLSDEYGQYQIIDNQKIPFAGYTRNLYQDTTEQGNQKLGLAATKGGFNKRYSGETAPGPLGVTVDNGADYEKVLPYNAATQYENEVHQNSGMIQSRAAGLGNVPKSTKELFGSGYTEYYKPDAPLYTGADVTDTSLPEGTYIPDTVYTGVAQGYEKAKSPFDVLAREAALSGTTTPGRQRSDIEKGSYVGNLIDAARYGLGATGAKIVDLVGDSQLAVYREVAKQAGVSEKEFNKQLVDKVAGTFAEDWFNKEGTDFVGMEGYKTPEAYGYDQTAINDWTKEFKDVVGSDKASTWDKLKVIASGSQLFPEVMASSLGDMVLASLPFGSGAALMAASEANQMMEERIKNTGGKPLTEEDRTIAIGAGIVYSAVNYMTRGMAGLKPFFTEAKSILTKLPDDAAKVVIAKAVAENIKGATEEGVEEIIQGIAENFGEKYATDKEGELFTKEDWLDLASQGVLGAHAGGGTHAAGTVLKETLPFGNEQLKSKAQQILEERKARRVRNEANKEPITTATDINVLDKLESNDFSTISKDIHELVKIEDTAFVSKDQATLDRVDKIMDSILERVATQEIDPADLQLGSRQDAEYFIGNMYHQAKKLEDTSTLDSNVEKIAESYGIKPEQLANIKNEATVEYEVSVGPRGYRTYERELEKLFTEPERNKEAISDVRDKLINLQDSQVERRGIIANAIDSLEAKIKSDVNKDGSHKVRIPRSGIDYIIHVKNGEINPANYGVLNLMDKTISNIEAVKGKYFKEDTDTEQGQASVVETAPEEKSAVRKEAEAMAREGATEEEIKADEEELAKRHKEAEEKTAKEDTDIKLEKKADKKRPTKEEAQAELDRRKKEKDKKDLTPVREQIKKYDEQIKEQLDKEEVNEEVVADLEVKKSKLEEKLAKIDEQENMTAILDRESAKKIAKPKSKATTTLRDVNVDTMPEPMRKFANAAKEGIDKVVRPFGDKVDESVLEKESPARSILFKENGEINKNVAAALQLALYNIMATRLDSLRPTTKRDVGRILGINEDMVQDYQLARLSDIGSTRTALVNEIGGIVVNALGIKANDIKEFARLKADLGAHVIELGVSKNILKVAEITAEEYSDLTGNEYSGASIQFIGLGDGVTSTKLKTFSENNDKLVEFLGAEMDTSRTPFAEAPPKRKYEVRNNNGITEVPKEAVKALRNAEKIKYKADKKSIEFVRENKDKIKKLLGWQDIKTMQGSFADKEGQKGKNLQIENSIESLLDNELDTMYFQWFYSKNGRYMIDSNTINPQTDKLHRFLVTPEDWDIIIDKNSKEDMDKFRYALAQSVGFSTDKESYEAIQAKGQEVLDGGSEALKEELKKAESEDDIEELGHFLMAIKALEAYEQGKDVFETNLVAEFDALTSGFGIKLMQFPILSNIYKWLEKVGVFTRSRIKAMSDKIAEEGFYDSYQTPAKEIRRDAVQPVTDPLDIWDELKELLPEAGEDGKISKELRDLFKNPFMVFNYGASIKNIKRAFSQKLTDKVLSGIAKGDGEYDALYKVLAKRYGKNLREMIQEQSSNSIKTREGTVLNNAIRDVISQTYGKQIDAIFTKEFGQFVELNKVINNSFREIFNSWEKSYKKKIAKLGDKVLTEEVQREIYKELRAEFPIIKGPLADALEEGVAIYDSGTMLLDGVDPVKSKFQSGSPTVRASRKELKGAGAAGAVLPIHYIDGAVMNKIMEKYTAQYIHDAIIPNLHEMDTAVKSYNENWYKINESYSIVDELIGTMKRVKEPSKKYKELMQDLKRFAKDINRAKKELYAQDVQIGHMVGMADSVWSKGDIKVEPATIVDKEATVANVKSVYNDAPKAIKKVMRDVAKKVAETDKHSQFRTVFKEIIENC